MRLLAELVICLHLMAPIQLFAAEPLKDPMSYSLRQYGFILAMSLLGGGVSWYAKVRRGELAATSVSAFVGEMTTAAFAGLCAFWVCEWAGVAPLLAAPVVGVAGHMGTKIITIGETALRRYVEARKP